MNSTKKLHNKAMNIAEVAFWLKKRNPFQSKLLFKMAYKLERSAAWQLEIGKDSEPTRCILYRSAASLAWNADRNDIALQLIYDGLQGVCAIEIRQELIELRDDIFNGKRSG